ncbi:MAG: CBS domain-containing protein [Chloroflexi bacterium]|jgi:CBS domain-containing protein|nr:CBS domain-containing protein [Chloroflexota bacterium]MBT4004080.1 CBS domain-containing protein [Chloroflexota bacterium]MBT4305890.1 CBS domain-containing protein [Chloroflexota bacterium]MBT4533715.1 CBS domain-containing protein [Chloroflexota bacterium]MBT4681642.1 CBS domain-containing protein [Chloroflexota bacterium]
MKNESINSPKLIRDLMTVGVFTCPPDSPIPELVRKMIEKDIETTVVQQSDGQAIGIVSKEELVKAYSSGDYLEKSAEEIMSPGLPQLPPDIPISAAAQIMQDNGNRVIFLMHNAGGISYPAAIISYDHILRHMAMESEEDIEDLGIQAKRKAPLDVFLERRDEAKRNNLSTLMDEE